MLFLNAFETDSIFIKVCFNLLKSRTFRFFLPGTGFCGPNFFVSKNKSNELLKFSKNYFIGYFTDAPIKELIKFKLSQNYNEFKKKLPTWEDGVAFRGLESEG
jgi:hypothetical protein